MKILLIGILVTEIIKYGIWFAGIDGLHLKRRFLGGSLACGYIGLILLGLVDEGTLIVVWNCMVIIMYGCMINCRKEERLAEILKVAFIIICAGEIVGNIMQSVLQLSLGTYKEFKVSYMASNILIIFCLCILYIVKRKVSIHENEQTKKLYDIIIYSAIVLMGTSLCLTISGIKYISKYVPEKRLEDFIKILVIISFISIICFIIILLYMIRENKLIKKYLENDKLLIMTQKSLYDAMLAKNKATVDFRHDLLGHLVCLNELIHKGDMEKVDAYLENMTGRIELIQNKVYTTENDVIDAVLNYFVAALDEEVRINVEGKCTGELSIEPVELCTITSNIFKNATEALCKKGDRIRYLDVSVMKNRGHMMLRVSNSIQESVPALDKRTGLPETSKEDKENHGIGLRNVKETVEKRGGIFNIDIGQEEFAVAIMLPLEIREKDR